MGAAVVVPPGFDLSPECRSAVMAAGGEFLEYDTLENLPVIYTAPVLALVNAKGHRFWEIGYAKDGAIIFDGIDPSNDWSVERWMPLPGIPW